MVSRRGLLAVGGLGTVLLATGTVEYHGDPGGLLVLGVVAGGAAVGYRSGAAVRGTAYGALVGVGLALWLAVAGAVAAAALILLTIPLHDGWGLLAFGVTGSVLASPLGPPLATVLLGGAALCGGFGGFVGGICARVGRTVRGLVERE